MRSFSEVVSCTPRRWFQCPQVLGQANCPNAKQPLCLSCPTIGLSLLRSNPWPPCQFLNTLRFFLYQEISNCYPDYFQNFGGKYAVFWTWPGLFELRKTSVFKFSLKLPANILRMLQFFKHHLVALPLQGSKADAFLDAFKDLSLWRWKETIYLVDGAIYNQVSRVFDNNMKYNTNC